MQKTIVAETTALAGSTTESLRNIELVKSLGLAQQEVGRLNGITAKILKLETQESEVPAQPEFYSRDGGQCAALRHFVLDALFDFPTGDHDRGNFFSLWIYSFYIFGPLQELGNVINVYRETEVFAGELFSRFSILLAIRSLPTRKSVDELMTLQF